jgi:hypothetical protein
VRCPQSREIAVECSRKHLRRYLRTDDSNYAPLPERKLKCGKNHILVRI